MNRATYYNTLRELENGKILVDGKFEEVESLKYHPVAECVNTELEPVTITSNAVMVEQTLNTIKNVKTYWNTGDSHIDKLCNINLIKVIFQKLENEDNIVYPAYEEIMDTPYEEILREPSGHLYKTFVALHVRTVMNYIVTKEQTIVVDDVITASDGTGVNLLTAEQTGFENMFDGYDLGSELITMEDIFEISPVGPEDDVTELVNLMSHLNIVLKHNAKVKGLTLGDYIEIIRESELFKQLDSGEFDMPYIRQYVDDLSVRIIDHMDYTKTNSNTEHSLGDVPIAYHNTIMVSVPDIRGVSLLHGLIVIVEDGMLEVRVEHRRINGFMTLFKAHVYFNSKVKDFHRTIYNLKDIENTAFGRVLIGELTNVGIIDLYLQ